MSTIDLRNVIRRIENARPPRPPAEPVEKVVGGAVVDTGDGRLVVARHEYPLHHRHGRYALADACGLSGETLRLVAKGGEAPSDPRDLLFVDVETTGLSGGTGTYAFLVGVGSFERQSFVVTQYFMRDFDEEGALLAALETRLAAAPGIVTFNGTGFDLPLLETRFILARRRWPAAIPHVDLLRPARRVWFACFSDCRLGTVEREALGLSREDDVSGALIPALYFQFVRTRQARPLARVFVHNRHDVLSLVALLGWFGRALAHDADASLTPLELLGLGRLWEAVDPERGLAYYRAALDRGLMGRASLWACLRVAAWEKRQTRWATACALWEKAARSGIFDPRPWEELAKFHEHRARDFATARELVTAALDLAGAAHAPAGTLAALKYRLARVEHRLKRGPRRAPFTPNARTAPAKPERSSISDRLLE